MKNLSGYERLRREHSYETFPNTAPRYPSEDTVIIHKQYELGTCYAYLGQRNDYVNNRRVYVLYCDNGSSIKEETTFDRVEAGDIFTSYVTELKRI